MHSTKTDILALLKRSDGSTVDDLASALSLAPMTVRQHLTALERDELVCSAEVRRSTGRPHYLFRLTDAGHRRVSDGHDRLLALLVEHAGTLSVGDVSGSPDECRARLFRRAAEALAATHSRSLADLAWDRRMELVVGILRSYGGFADWHDLGDGQFEIHDFNCAFRAIVSASGPCEWHEPFLSSILGVPVRSLAEPAGRSDCCRQLVTIQALVGAAVQSR